MAAIRRLCSQVDDESLVWDKISVATKKKLLESQFQKFDEHHSSLVAAAEDEELKIHEDIYNIVIDLYEDATNKLQRLVPEVEVVKSPKVEGESRERRGDMRMTPLDIRVFDGQDIHWLQFQDLFEAMVHKSEMDSAFKLARLVQYVDKKEVPMVGGVYTGGYELVWEELKKRYNRPKRLIAAHLKDLMELENDPEESRKRIREVIDRFQNYVRAMTVLKLPTDQWNGILVPLFLQKVPSEAAAYFNRRVEGDEIPKFERVLRVVEDYADTVADVMSNGVAAAAVKHVRPWNPVNNHGEGMCAACEQDHLLSGCSRFRGWPVQQRFERVRAARLCFKCLSNSHMSSECGAGVCEYCSRNHHHLLCEQSNVSTAGPGSPLGTQPQIYPRA